MITTVFTFSVLSLANLLRRRIRLIGYPSGGDTAVPREICIGSGLHYFISRTRASRVYASGCVKFGLRFDLRQRGEHERLC